MATKKSTGYATETRRCTGSARFGIEPHEAPVSTFPKQPSRKDGLGTMCAEHWKAYVKGLAADRRARGSVAARDVIPGTGGQLALTASGAKKIDAALARNARKAATEPTKVAKPTANADAIAKAEMLIAEVDALPADQHLTRVGDDEVQRAFETVAAARMLAD